VEQNGEEKVEKKWRKSEEKVEKKWRKSEEKVEKNSGEKQWAKTVSKKLK
jgi:hypothetical protein